jgi:hypothetical protein
VSLPEAPEVGLRARVVREADGDGEVEVEYHCRLAVPVVLMMRNGTRVRVSALVDTGSEMNLVRCGLMDDQHSRPFVTEVSFYAIAGVK